MKSQQGDTPGKMLVVIASYGTGNDRYLSLLIDEYRSMPLTVDIVVLSNIQKDLGDKVEVIVGLPTDDPWSLPFGHKAIFADRLPLYDLFIYSEDDTLITYRNVEAFLRASECLKDDELAGFLRFEKDEEGRSCFPDVHGNYHWDSQSLRTRAGRRFAFFNNEHAAAYILTRSQLKRAVDSGGFLAEPRRGKYDLLCTAATDPYTRCGFIKLIGISELPDFLVHHLPNKYVGRMGITDANFECQIKALLSFKDVSEVPAPLFDENPEFKASHFGKNYYEPVRSDLIDLIPKGAQNILSIGCGWGATEEELSRQGKNVTAVPLDSVISACAEVRGVHTVAGDPASVLRKLSNREFDCLLISNVLHLVENPETFLNTFSGLLSQEGTVIASVPNLGSASVLWRKLRGIEPYPQLGDFKKSGVHRTSHQIVRKWLRGAGLGVSRFVDIVPERARALRRSTFSLMTPFLSSEIVAIATRTATNPRGAKELRAPSSQQREEQYQN